MSMWEDNSGISEYGHRNEAGLMRTFEDFVVGASNRSAYIAAEELALNGGPNGRLLVLYGKSGTGKTHLLHAVAHAAKRKNPGCSVKLFTSEMLIERLIYAVGSRTYRQLEKIFLGTDYFLLDGLQDFCGKEQTQDLLSYFLERLYKAGCCIVLSTDIPLEDLSCLNVHICKDFEHTTIIKIDYPDEQTRYSILKQTMSQYGLSFGRDEIKFIANRITGGVPRLEGLVKRLLAERDFDPEGFSAARIRQVVEWFVSDVC